MSKESKQETLLLHLPSEILTNIFLKLPFRSIVSCKYVCKEFLQIISTREFAKSHLSLSTLPGLAIYQHQKEGLFKLLEHEDTLKLQTHHLHDLEVMKFESNTFMGATSQISCWGSVDGILCLGHYSDTDLGSVYICNPITREVIHITMPKCTIGTLEFTRFGFGLSALSGQYKVVVNYIAEMNECFVYTLGTTGSWRRVAHDALSWIEPQYTASLFMNGNLHWLVMLDDSITLISCFDLEIELFKSFSPPQNWNGVPHGASLVILEDCLCLFDSVSDDYHVVLWVMKEYGIEKSWTRKFQISKSLLEDWSCVGCADIIYIVKAFADGGILFSWENELLFYHCNKTKSTRSVEVFEENSQGYSDRGLIETSIHKFSFLSLKSFGVENVISF